MRNNLLQLQKYTETPKTPLSCKGFYNIMVVESLENLKNLKRLGNTKSGNFTGEPKIIDYIFDIGKNAFSD